MGKGIQYATRRPDNARLETRRRSASQSSLPYYGALPGMYHSMDASTVIDVETSARRMEKAKNGFFQTRFVRQPRRSRLLSSAIHERAAPRLLDLRRYFTAMMLGTVPNGAKYDESYQPGRIEQEYAERMAGVMRI